MRRRSIALAIAATAFATPAWAIPAFARRYEVACHFCHEGYPKLNQQGQRFKERGFRLEQEDAFDADRWLRTVPVVVRANVSRFFIEDGDGITTSFIKGVSAGNLGTRFSYWVDDALVITEGEDDVTHVKPNNAWGRFEVLTDGKLYVRGGRMELDVPFTNVRTPHLFGYEIYSQNTGFETDTIGIYQEGVEVGGTLPGDAHWSAALVKGRNSAAAEAFSSEAGDFDANVFLRAHKRAGRQRFGAFAYFGQNTLATSPSVVWEDEYFRFGADADLWLQRLNLYGVFMYGRNDNSIATPASPSGTGEELSFSGGFAQADYHATDNLALTLRLNMVRRPPGSSNLSRETFSSLYPGIQVWVLQRLKLSFEYGFQNKDRPGLGIVQAEVAF